MRRIGLAEIDKLVVELGADLAVCVVVAESARGRCALELRLAHQLFAEGDELVDIALQILDLGALGFDDVVLPQLCRRVDSVEVDQQFLGEGLGSRPIRRHVDAAQFHHSGIDEPVDLLEILHAVPGHIAAGSGLSARRQITGIEDDAHDRNEPKEPDDHKQLGLERKSHSTLVRSASLMAREISALRQFMRLQVHPGPRRERARRRSTGYCRHSN